MVNMLALPVLPGYKRPSLIEDKLLEILSVRNDLISTRTVLRICISQMYLKSIFFYE